jgi:hypothetical protein
MALQQTGHAMVFAYVQLNRVTHFTSCYWIARRFFLLYTIHIEQEMMNSDKWD